MITNYGSRKPELGVVGDLNRLVEGVEPNDRRHRAEGLTGNYRMIVPDVIEYRRRIDGAFALVANHNLGALIHRERYPPLISSAARLLMTVPTSVVGS